MESDQMKLDRLTRKWIDRLGLGAWLVKVRFVRWWEMHRHGAMAGLTYNVEALTADVIVLDPEDLPPNERSWSTWGDRIEGSIVHELLHLVLVPLDELATESDRYQETILENAVNLLERALAPRGE